MEILDNDELKYNQTYIEPILDTDAVEEVSDELYNILRTGSEEDLKDSISDAIQVELVRAGVSVDDFVDYLESKLNQVKINLSSLGLNDTQI
jgi:hypothetical protein